MDTIEFIKNFFTDNNIDYKFVDHEFIINSKYKMLFTRADNKLFLLNIEGLDVGNWLNSAEYEMEFLLEIIKNIYFNKYKIVKKGFINRDLYLIIDLKTKRNFKLGKVIK